VDRGPPSRRRAHAQPTRLPTPDATPQTEDQTMKRDEATKLTETALGQLAEALEQGHSKALTLYLQTLARFHRYSFGNVLLIACQRPGATQVAGFHTWRKLGRIVKKGEKGIAILAPLVRRQSVDALDLKPDEDEQLGREKACSVRGFKVVHVFDVSQTEGRPLPEFAEAEGDPRQHLDQLRQAVHRHGIVLNYGPIPGGALGISQGGNITVRPDLTPAEEFSVLVHEFAHELLHKGERRGETTKTVRETEAEAVAFVVSQVAGLDTKTRSSDYIQLYRGNTEMLAESLEHIQRAATTILSALDAHG
jgi:hypothetical protein